jgi:hypothetical protein
MQHPDHANSAADKAWVQGQLLQGSRGRAKEDMVEAFLVAPGYLLEISGQSEGDHEVGCGQQQLLLLNQPLFRGLILAFGTMAVLARVIAIQGFITRFTMVDVTAQSLGAALFDSRHRLLVTEWHSLAELLPIFETVTAEDLGHLDHDGSAINRLTASAASASARRVRWV